MRNPFDALTKEEKKKKVDSQKAQKQHVEETVIAAKHCLSTAAFRVYVERYEKAEKILIKRFKDLEFNELSLFAVQCRDIQSTLNMLEALKVDVKKDAGK